MATQCNITDPSAFEASARQLEQEQQLAAQAKALAHPARIRILKLLLTLDNLGGCLNSDLVSQLGLAQSTVSEHLRILKQAGFISAEPNPPKMCYRIERQALNGHLNLLEAMLS
ncbi:MULTISPECIES: ArsR/SmtB family transcription factor [Vibrio]|uniref:Putative ArsR family transcriptional regulator n=1 Tax=Vibrio proteolyticus NBRC 13287 TaxID=1219065 RepID=U3BFB5_VIBPR|nr:MULTISPECIES: winged helix-turn-helix domain-containing protein [Vibrio]NAW58286.1 metalloregulator ArsR/SmtB family transcription factor [Vibrio sp. V36_P2S2PM302]NAX23151.1 metalloregulator ArsR/SmtB family transcription factor [Vibrio sp. V39_P1S14PM300]NAX25942.1 metalloregulator ArsR/SmtB family transcription factor [Vibrio sp. V38_P2S17PM301]NAX32754.1 metalloregulator ArsR/SmtB family transcription factor [Vibrio sp. V37_P2S8PM304]GAD68399.1 putative ArsR family transcriptional regul